MKKRYQKKSGPLPSVRHKIYPCWLDPLLTDPNRNTMMHFITLHWNTTL